MTARDRIDYKLRVHTVPDDLKPPLLGDRTHLEAASVAYHVAVESRLLWDVWMIDKFGSLWIAVSFENARGAPEFHTVRVDPDTCRKVTCEAYETIVEEP